MDYNEFAPDWDCVDLPERAALDARLADMLVQHLDEDPSWAATVTNLASDLTANDETRRALTRVAILVGNILIYNHGGRAEAVAAVRSQLVELRRIAMRGVDE